jgi:hypothetical protein
MQFENLRLVLQGKTEIASIINFRHLRVPIQPHYQVSLDPSVNDRLKEAW